MASIVFLLAVYAGVVCAQPTIVERVLREEEGCTGTVLRAVLSVVHGFIAYMTLLGIGCQLSAIVFHDYRRPILGAYGVLILYFGALFGLLLPWLPALLRRRRGRAENGSKTVIMVVFPDEGRPASPPVRTAR